MQKQQQQQQQQQRRIQRDLSTDELATVIKEAARRQGEDLKREQTGAVANMDDAYALAREIGIPEEYVTEAAGQLESRRFADAQFRQIRGRRLLQLLAMLGIGVGAVAVAMLFNIGGWLTFVGIAGIAGLIVLVALIRWLSVAVGDTNLKHLGPPAVPGRCRVCGQTAVTPESTFCEEHRYRSPAELRGSGE